ncbi:MAG: hypothetical protein ACI4GY_07700 [Acutalibacteraceae bacterium]
MLKKYGFVPIFKFIAKNGRGIVLTDTFKRVFVLDSTFDNIVIGEYVELSGKWFKDKYNGFCFTEKQS